MTKDDFDLPEPESDGDRQLLAQVREGGWQVILIPGDSKTPGWAFTIGLYANFAHPEIVIFGLPRRVAHPVLNVVGEQVKAGARFVPENLYADILGDLDCTFRQVNECWYPPFLGYCNWFHQGTDYPVLQCFWPDKEQRFPWEPAFHKDWLEAQPLLHHVDPAEARAVAWIDSVETAQTEAAQYRDSVEKVFAIPGDKIRPLAHGYGACFATDMILVDGKKVGYMYREDPDNDVDGGWRFMAGPESEEYMDNVDNIALYDVNTIANYDPDIIPFLDAPSGSAFARVDGDGVLQEVDCEPEVD